MILTKVIWAVWAIVDMTYLAQYRLYTEDILQAFESSLALFHDNKNIFVHLGACVDFCVPKIHSLKHYVECIRWFGATDNTNTQFTKRLHIDLVKVPYRASNRRDELPQMMKWIERSEKMQEMASRIYSHENRSTINAHVHMNGEIRHLVPKLPKWPTRKALSFDTIETAYDAADFRYALARFLIRTNNPQSRGRALHESDLDYVFQFSTVRAYHTVKFMQPEETGMTEDILHARPKVTKKGVVWSARFDPVVLQTPSGECHVIFEDLYH